MKYIIILISIGLFWTLSLSAKTYEDGEDKKTSRWETLSPSSEATIKNKYDKEKRSRVIEFDGDGTKSAYILKIDAKQKRYLLSWQMKYSEDFVIFISLETELGKRYLIYTPGNKNAYMQYGLGYASMSGTWQRYSRNLEKDLRYFDNRNSIVKINSFVIRGSGSIDNVQILKELKSKDITEKDEFSKEIEQRKLKVRKRIEDIKKTETKIQKSSSKIVKKPLKIKHRVVTNTTPIITIKGENPLFLKIGESFEEPGVSAEDKEDGELSVTSSEDIDIYKEGKYAVIYMAIDSAGNSAIDKRYVIVGNGDSEEDSAEEESEYEVVNESNKSSKQSKEEESDAQYRLEERELEIAEWERELQFREKEISQREKSLLK